MPETETVKARVHVNQPHIKRNIEEGTSEHPVLTVHRDGEIEFCGGLEILDRSGRVVARMVYDRENPLAPYGAHVWLEADHGVRLAGEACPVDPEPDFVMDASIVRAWANGEGVNDYALREQLRRWVRYLDNSLAPVRRVA